MSEKLDEAKGAEKAIDALEKRIGDTIAQTVEEEREKTDELLHASVRRLIRFALATYFLSLALVVAFMWLGVYVVSRLVQ